MLTSSTPATCLGAALLCLAGVVHAQPALPGLGADPARQSVDVAQPPWRGIVRVQNELGRRCTGALVGPRLALTAAHCLLGRATGHLVQPGSIHVLSGYARGDYAGHARATAIRTGDGTAPDADWALLTLDAPLGTPDRVLPLAAALPTPGTPAMLAGYEQDRAETLLADTACRILGSVSLGGALLLRHDCAATRGASGAPLLIRHADGHWAIAGIASQAFRANQGGLAIPATTIR